MPRMREPAARIPDTLRRTPAVLDALLRGVPDDVARWRETPDTWSAHDVIGHLVDGEVHDWIPRARLILAHGESRPFTPFDRFAHLERAGAETLSGRLDQFAALRADNLAALAAIVAEDFGRTGTHPEFGAVTLGQLLSTWAAHDLSHVAQAARALARGWRDDAGPWVRYLRLLQ